MPYWVFSVEMVSTHDKPGNTVQWEWGLNNSDPGNCQIKNPGQTWHSGGKAEIDREILALLG